MAYLGHLPYNPATDPKALFAQGLQNYLGGLNQQIESRRFGKALTESDSPDLQQLGKLVLGGKIPLQQAMAIGSMMQKSTPNIEQLRARRAVETGAQPGTEEFETIAKGRETPESESQYTAYLARKIAEGNASEEEEKIFEMLAKVPSTSVTVNTGETGQTVRERLGAFKEGQEAIKNFKDNPENKDLADNFNIGITTDTKGIPTLDIKGKGGPTSEQMNKKGFLELLKKKVARIEELAQDKSKRGPVEGRLAKLKAKYIGGEPVATELNQLLDSLIIRVYMLSGKQINETELRFLKGIQPQSWMPDDTFDTTLNGFMNELKDMSEITDDLWSSTGIKTIGAADQKTNLLNSGDVSTEFVKQYRNAAQLFSEEDRNKIEALWEKNVKNDKDAKMFLDELMRLVK